jgi:hypothetical protein
MVEIDRHKASLIAELDVSRSEVRNALARCEESLDVVSQLRRNVQENKVAWAAGAGILGFVASRILWHGIGRAAKGTGSKGSAGTPAGALPNQRCSLGLAHGCPPSFPSWRLHHSPLRRGSRSREKISP